MAALGSPCQLISYKTTQKTQFRHCISCTMQPPQNNTKVVINGVTKEIGKAAVVAVTKARGMEVAGAVDSHLVGEDVGKVCNMEEALEIPILNDLTMVLGSISQSKATGVVVDFTEPSTVYDNVKQATAFGMKSVVYVPQISLDTVAALSAFCEKASMVSQGLSNNPNIIHWINSTPTSCNFCVFSLQQCGELNQGQMHQIFHHRIQFKLLTTFPILVRYSTEKIYQALFSQARGQLLGEDGIRVHSLVLPGLPSSTTVHFSGVGEVYSLKHDITDVQCLMPGLILAIRKVLRLKNLIYGLEKVL